MISKILIVCLVSTFVYGDIKCSELKNIISSEIVKKPSNYQEIRNAITFIIIYDMNSKYCSQDKFLEKAKPLFFKQDAKYQRMFK